MAKIHHPDLNNGDNKVFTDVNEAYQTLKDE